MFQYMKKQYDQEREAVKTKEKLGSKDQGQARQSLTPDELQRLEAAKRSLNQKFVTSGNQQTGQAPVGDPTTASFRTTYNVTFKQTRQPPGVLPKPSRKSVVVKEKSRVLNRFPSQNLSGNTDPADEERGRNGESGELIIKTTQIPSVRDAILAFEHPPVVSGGGGGLTPQRKPRRTVQLGSFQTSFSSASSIDSRTSFIDETGPVITSTTTEILSPAEKDYNSVNLQLPSITPQSDALGLRQLVLQRRQSGDFGFTLRKGVVRRCAVNGTESWRNVIFAEPGDKSGSCGLMPGDRLIEVDGVSVENYSKDDIIELIKKTRTSLKLQVEPSNELSELSLRAELDNGADTSSSLHLGNDLAKSSTVSSHRSKQVCRDLIHLNISSYLLLLIVFAIVTIVYSILYSIINTKLLLECFTQTVSVSAKSSTTSVVLTVCKNTMAF